MTGKEFKDIWAMLDKEGIDKTFENDFSEISDKRFHRLRNLYREARKNLVEYLGWEKNNV